MYRARQGSSIYKNKAIVIVVVDALACSRYRIEMSLAVIGKESTRDGAVRNT